MRTRVLLFAVFTISLFALGVLITTIFNTAPGPFEVLTLFYISFFLTAFGAIFFTLYLRYYLTAPTVIPGWQQTAASFRIAVLISSLLSIMLALQASKLLNLGTVLVLVVAVVLLELVVRRRQ